MLSHLISGRSTGGSPMWSNKWRDRQQNPINERCYCPKIHPYTLRSTSALISKRVNLWQLMWHSPKHGRNAAVLQSRCGRHELSFPPKVETTSSISSIWTPFITRSSRDLILSYFGGPLKKVADNRCRVSSSSASGSFSFSSVMLLAVRQLRRMIFTRPEYSRLT